VILNPGSGPGKARDPNYVAAVDRVRAAGGRVLGYVHSSYAKRPRAAVEQDIRAYLQFYGVDGFFIDEMANTPQPLGYYASIYQSIKQLDSRFKVVGNPGTPYTLAAYLNAVDTLVIFEGPAAAYADYQPMGPAPWVADYPRSRFANLVYAVNDAASMQQALTAARQTNAGSVFITDDKLPNPYRGLPRYWTEELAAVAALDLPPPSGPASSSGVEPAPAGSLAIGERMPGAVIFATAAPVPPTILVPQRPHHPGLFRRLFLGFRPACRPPTPPPLAGSAGP
jgi:hypothetical protein